MINTNRQNRYQATYSNQIHQLASSPSEHFFPIKRIGNDWIVKLRASYKAKERKNLSHYVIVYALADDFSGYRQSRYFIAPDQYGEKAINFLKWAWDDEEDHPPFRGRPKLLFMANDEIANNQFFKDFCYQNRVEIITPGLPGVPRSLGKVAGNFKDQWKGFETSFFFNPSWKDYEITLTELNQQLAAFWMMRNKKQPHRILKISREEAWIKHLTI